MWKKKKKNAQEHEKKKAFPILKPREGKIQSQKLVVISRVSGVCI